MKRYLFTYNLLQALSLEKIENNKDSKLCRRIDKRLLFSMVDQVLKLKYNFNFKKY